MDKYEFRVKTDQIKKLVNRKDYSSALKIAETIDWTKVRNMSLLTLISEVYEKNERYEESMDYLFIVYERYPAGRTVVYKLAELSILTGDYEEAIKFYQEYARIAPYDTAKDVLKYKISKGKGKSIDGLIKILEDLKEKDYQEEWAYELAKLYHEAGRGDECVAECDEIDLWFGEGYYVIKALELKLLYQPLTPVQMKKYENRYEYKESEGGLEEVDLNEGSDIKVRQFSLDRFNTQNLQEELAKSMEQIMSATEKETVDTTMESVKKLVEESNIKELLPEEPVVYEEILAEDDDGQISLYVPEDFILEKQITGQLTIEDVLKEWEKTKAAAERAIEESRIRQLEKAKSRALEETGNILERLADVLPFADGDRAVVEEAMEGIADTPDFMAEFPDWDESTEEVQKEVSDESQDLDGSEESPEIIEEDGHVLDDMVEDLEESLPVNLLDLEATKEWIMPKTLFENESEESVTPESERMPEEAAATQEEEEVPEEKTEIKEEKSEKEVKEEKAPRKMLSKEQEEILSYFLEIPTVKEEITNLGDNYPQEPFIVISGRKGSGKTSLATRIIKAAQLSDKSVGKRIAKTTGESINQKNVVQILEKMVKGALIIEGADQLNEKSLEALEKNIPNYIGRLQIYLLGEEDSLEKTLKKNPELEKMCKKKIKLPVYKNADLVVFAKAYAKAQNYSIDDMGMLALYTRLGVKQTEYHKVDLGEVKEIIDEAITRSSKFSFKKMFGRIFSSRIDDDGFIILGEKDILEDED